ncbi:acyl-CoA dehydrogenase [Alicyclobacillus cellulosilyticus]|uniref:Acyl-CoA dehydrogenase n=1 Tax=Alicyclobacillus cellulosilyticus TaxID=1003997 RepID=A0A917NMP5_9BACL|nr:acyl-CoA dehydrogenase family protein [Alicyclobacillus cellulosilyticus]GGJ12425.1 acyl-CoA dehydrogenase [Alicyclobacillus cellulosilyticus]
MNEATFAALKQEVWEYVHGPLMQWGEQIEATGEVPAAIWQDLRARGYLRLAAPEAFGGRGLPFPQYLELLEIFSRAHGSIRMIVHVMNGIWRPLNYLADDDIRARWVKPCVQGEITVAFTLTEPIAGTGADLHTAARRVGDEYVLNGEKWLITFADVADYFLLFARLEGTTGSEGTVALMVPRDAPGLDIQLMPESMGLTGTGHGHLYLRDCRVPVANRIGAEGDGLAVALRGFLDPSRISIGMSCVGLASRAFDLAVARSKERVTFGKPLCQRQVIQMYIAEMATDIEAARQLVLHAARVYDSGQPATHLSAMAKLYGLEMLQRVTDRAIQIFGGIGYFKPMEIERIYRDARAQRFEEGTAEIQKAVIARHVLGTAK